VARLLSVHISSRSIPLPKHFRLALTDFNSYGIQFLVQAGLDTSDSYKLSLGQNGISLVGCFIAWYIMSKSTPAVFHVYSPNRVFREILMLTYHVAWLPLTLVGSQDSY
jgi:hypothetical protein